MTISTLHTPGLQKDITLIPAQEEFLFNHSRFLGYFGGVGNGKTTIGCLKMIEIARHFPNSRLLIARKSWPSLESTTMEEFFTLCHPDLIDAVGTRRSAGSPQCKFKNGSVILFRHLESSRGGGDNPFQRLSNLNLNAVLIDQAEEVDERWFNLFRSRLRRVVYDDEGKRCPHQFMLIGNMAGHNWIYFTFKEPRAEGADNGDYHLIEASTMENKDHLPPEYVRDLLNTPKNWQDRYVWGSWDDFEGLVFNEISRTRNEIELGEIPPSWERYRSIDHGQTNPTACSWWAVDNDGNCFMYREYYEPGLTIMVHTENIMRLSKGEKYILTYWDPSVYYKTLQNEERGFHSIYDLYMDQTNAIINRYPEFADVGLWGLGGNNDVAAGVGRVNDYAQEDETHFHPVTRERGSPHLFFLKDQCPNFWVEHGDYNWKLPKGGVDFIGSVKQTEVPDPSKHDHLLDGMRYFIMSRPPVNQIYIPSKRKGILDRWAEKRGRTRNQGVESWKVA